MTVRADDTELHELLAAIEDPEARAVSPPTSALLAALDGSCRTPIGGHARMLENGRLRLTGLVARADGSFLLRRTEEGNAKDAVRLGDELGQALRRDSPGSVCVGRWQRCRRAASRRAPARRSVAAGGADARCGDPVRAAPPGRLVAALCV